MKSNISRREAPCCDRVTGITLVVIAIVACVDLVRYIALGSGLALLTVSIIECIFLLVSIAAWKGRMPWILILVSVPSIVLFSTMNNMETTMFNAGFLILAVVSIAGAVVGTVSVLRSKVRVAVNWISMGSLVLAALIAAGSLTVWALGVHNAKGAGGLASREIWAVPEQFDSVECEWPGTVEQITYQTKAYATDGRDVVKSAYVYLPNGYDETKQYNILYLLHGTGDDERYWLVKNSYNKTMLDNLIANGDIDPLIVVTPTFYVEDDCKDTGLDPLTYSFVEELRNDLMPAVESIYATYAETCDEEGFAASRDHRAFAGLSRGAVTTYHSVFCGALDYFSWFGTFSGSRTDADYFQQTIQSEEFVDYPINYLYVASGNFDFALPRQIQDYDGLLSIESRLEQNVNTNFDIFPMRYHSMGNWHLALYNFLQKIF